MDVDPRPPTNFDREISRYLDFSRAVPLPSGDLPEEGRAVESLRRTTELLRAIFASSPVPVITLDQRAVVTGWNPAAERTFGWKAEEVIGRPYPLAPQDRQQELMDNVRFVLEGGAFSQRESVRQRKDGSVLDVTISTAPLRNAKNEVVGIMVLMEDITDRKRAEAELRASELLFRSVFENAAVGIIVTDLRTDLRMVNAAYERFIGYSREEVVAGGVGSYCHPEDLEEHLRLHREQMSGERDLFQLEKRYIRKDGRVVWGRVVASLVRDQDGAPLYAIGMVEDITARKQAEAELLTLNEQLEQRVAARTVELEDANREMEAFSYSVSHDLRAPLRSIDGFSQALQEDYGDRLDEQGSEYLARIRAASRRMGLLIDGLLGLSRLSRTELKREIVDLSTMASSVALDLRAAQPEREVEFVIQPWLVATGDEQQLRLVLENLLGNAWKFTSKHPAARIEFGSMDVAGRRAFFVRDNGVGFDMAYSNKLFGVFQRLHGHTEFEGTGIGLASVQRIIQRHGGRVWAEGRPGEGATFFFTL